MENLAGLDAVLVIDGTGFPKQRKTRAASGARTPAQPQHHQLADRGVSTYEPGSRGSTADPDLLVGPGNLPRRRCLALQQIKPAGVIE